MRAAVAAQAGGERAAALLGLRVKAAVVGCLLVTVTSCAGDFSGRVGVRRGLYIGVAIHAGIHPTVHRTLELIGIDVQTDRLSIDVLGKAGIAVAGQAVFVGRLLRSGGTRPHQQDR